jgi:predicted dehydrogenase
MSSNVTSVLIIGAGPMTIEYVKVLDDLNIQYTVVGRGVESAKQFKDKSNKDCFVGGLQKFINENDCTKYSHAIVVTGVDALYKNTKLLIEIGIKNILVEKPGALLSSEITDITLVAKQKSINCYIAYNRRCFQSVKKAKEIIKEDGGVTSFHFEFTEWAHVIEPLKTDITIKNKWFLANSSHVVDLAFFLGGKPKQLSAYKSGSIAWHSYAKYSGAGITHDDSVFSYHANWLAPGRWSVEIMTAKHRLYFKPMESLQIQNIGSVAVTPFEINDELDKKFKPGLYIQTKAFLENNFSSLCSIDEQVENSKWFDLISGYDTK